MKTCTLFCAIILTFFTFTLSGCSAYNFAPKPVTPASAYPGAIEKAKKDKRYFILQSGINFYNVTSVDLNREKQQMTVTLDKVDSLRLAYFKNPEMARTKAGSSSAEIHVFMKDSTSYTMDEPHTIPVQNVARIELVGKG